MCIDWLFTLAIADTAIHLRLHEIVQWWYNGHEIYEIYSITLWYRIFTLTIGVLQLVNNGPAMVNIYSDQNTVAKLQCNDIVIVICVYKNCGCDGLVMTNFNENEW